MVKTRSEISDGIMFCQFLTVLFEFLIFYGRVFFLKAFTHGIFLSVSGEFV